jgi:hypothetical protein
VQQPRRHRIDMNASQISSQLRPIARNEAPEILTSPEIVPPGVTMRSLRSRMNDP